MSRSGVSRLAVLRPFVLVGAVAAFVAVTASRLPAQGDERGERLMNANCLDCHDIRRIQTQAKSIEEWTATITTMIEKGAKVGKDDVPVLADYLTDHHGPLPEGRGKLVLLNVCTLCHDLSRIRRGRRSAEEWEETLNSMLNEGAPLSDAAFPLVHEYLSRNFGVD